MSGQRWAEVRLGAVEHNVRALRSLLPPATRLLAVVKADGYGHGAPAVAAAALRAGAWGLAVSTLEEARELRDLAAGERVLAMGGLVPGQAREAAAAGCAVACYGEEVIRALEEAASVERPLPVHLKVDTGMGRLGCPPEAAPGLARRIASSDRLRLAGTFTHFSSAGVDPVRTRRQLELFRQVLAAIPEPGLRHAANSAATLHHPEAALDAVRAGIALYGCEAGGVPPPPAGPLRPVLSLRALVTHVKEVPAGTSVGYGAEWTAAAPARVATVAIGYADGVHRARGGRGWALVRGGRAPVIGRISMDSMALDVTALSEVRLGDVATLIGTDGPHSISAEEVASWSGTISYEVLTSIGRRVRRQLAE